MAWFTTDDGRRLHFEDTGPGKPPVLCLGGLTRNLRDFDHIPALLPDRRIIRLSTRGRGESDHAADPEHEYTAGREAQDALELLDHLGVPRCALIGTSRGGILGMAIAAMRPGALTGLVLNDVGARVETDGLRRIAAYAGRPLTDCCFTDAAKRLQRAHDRDFPGVPLERWERHARACFDEGPDGRPVLAYDPRLAEVTLGNLKDAGPHLDLYGLWGGCEHIPVLLLRGENSDILSDHTLAEMAVGRTGYTARRIPDRGHAPFLDEPAAIDAIRSFLEKTPPP